MFSWRSWQRTWAIARLTLKVVARQRLVAAFLLLALVLGFAALGLRDLNFGRSEAAFVADCGFGVMALVGSALAIAVTAQLLLAELESGTVQPLLAKPVTRVEFVVGKFLGVALLLAAFCALLALLMALVITSQPAVSASADAIERHVVTWHALVDGSIRQWLKLTVLTAFVLLVACYARGQFFVIVAGIVLVLGSHLQPLAHDAFARSSSWLVRSGGWLATGWLPDFTLFAPAPEVGATPAASLGFLIAYAAGHVLIAGGLAIFCFSRREL
jgi:ABC-type transport system involved in multi-copper enzyme maturation permease subunit